MLLNGLDGANRSYIYWQVFYFCGQVGVGGVEKSRLKLTSAKVELEVEAVLGNRINISEEIMVREQ